MRLISYFKLILPTVLFAFFSFSIVNAKTVIRTDEAAIGEADPAKFSDNIDSIIIFNTYDALVDELKNGAGLAPHLASGWEYADATTLNVTLKDGIKFHSGNILDADDVVYSFNRLMDMGQGFSFLFGTVESVTALDSKTVQIKTSEPFAPLIASLMRLAIVDKDDVQANTTVDGNYGDNGDYGEAYLLTTSAGTGAYKITQHDPNVKTVLTKNNDYFLDHNAKAPDEVIIKYSVEAATIKTLLMRGEHEISSMWLPNEVLAALEKEDSVDLVKINRPGSWYNKLNNRRAPLDDVHCRRALQLAYDYDALYLSFAITEDMVAGQKSSGALIPGVLGYDPNKAPIERDIDKAKAELAKCKYNPSDYTLDLAWIAEVPYEEPWSLQLQANAIELGFDATVTGLPWAKFTEQVANWENTPHATVVSVLANVPDPDALMFAQWHSSRGGTWMSAEWAQDAELDALLEKGRTETNADERIKIYQAANQLMIDNAITLFITDFVGYQAISQSVSNSDTISTQQGYGTMGRNLSFREMAVN
ncbi:MAG: ABC transporter substrate-binding protein [Alphaproteobacteria bacterium]|jgi:peptide/nickel transport system substrate-binding protein|nr:ABC transporter substrate-binding protein [Alphaproteobacteria bacterium]